MDEKKGDIEKILAQRAKLDELLRTQFTKKITVMFTDIKGSTSYYEQRGNVDGRLMVHRHNELVMPVIAQNRGILIKTIGDATMSVYDDPNDGVRAAQQIQQRLREYNGGRPEGEQINVRIGMNTGLGIVEEKDVFGDVVNTASRVEALADGGEVMVTEELYHEVKNNDEFIFRFADRAKVKGKKEALKAYRLVWHEEALFLGRTRNIPQTLQAREGIFVLDASVSGRNIKISAYTRKDGEERAVKNYREIPFDEEKVRNYTADIIGVLNRANRRGKIGNDLLIKLKDLGGLLFDRLMPVEIKDMLKTTAEGSLMLSIDDHLVHVPWELLYDGRDFLCQRFSMGRSVSTRQAVSVVVRALQWPLKMQVLADPRGDLNAAYEEGVAIKNEISGFEEWIDVSLKTTDISTDYAKSKIRNFDIVHYAGHAEHDANQPGESGWLLRDGRLSANGIMAMAGTRPMPALVFSNACQTGQTDAWKLEADYGTRIFGLANAFLLSGVQHYIGTFWEIPDEAGALFARSFYRSLANGTTIGHALRLARQALIETYGEDTIVWASYMLYGDPTTRYVTTEQSEVTGAPDVKRQESEMIVAAGMRGFEQQERGKGRRAVLIGAATGVLIASGLAAFLFFGKGRGPTALADRPPVTIQSGQATTADEKKKAGQVPLRAGLEPGLKTATQDVPNDRAQEQPAKGGQTAGDQGAERAQLEKLGFEYKVEKFLKAVADDNTAVAELFIKAGIDVNAKTEKDGDTALLLAIRNKNEKIAKMVIDAGASLNAQNAAGDYPLHAASDAGLCDVVRRLIAAKADVKAGGPRSLTAAASSGFTECARALVDAGVPLNGDEGAMAAGLAAARGDADVVRLLIDKGMDVRSSDKYGRRLIDTLLFSAAYTGKTEVIRLLLEKGADKNARGSDGDTPLMRTIQRKSKDDAFKLFLSKGADVNAENKRGETALYLAVQKRNPELAKMLMNAGADPYHATIWRTTPLMEAVRADSQEMLSLLARRDARINTANNQGESALVLAVEKKNTALLKILISAGADCSLPDKYGTTPVMRAVDAEWDEGVRLLAKSGAHMEAVNNKGETALIQALHTGRPKMAVVLLENNADPGTPDKAGDTPLIWATHLSAADIMRQLIRKGADVNAANRDGKTALHVAVERNQEELAKILVAAKADTNKADKRGVSPLELAKARGWERLIAALEKR